MALVKEAEEATFDDICIYITVQHHSLKTQWCLVSQMSNLVAWNIINDNVQHTCLNSCYCTYRPILCAMHIRVPKAKYKCYIHASVQLPVLYLMHMHII